MRRRKRNKELVISIRQQVENWASNRRRPSNGMGAMRSVSSCALRRAKDVAVIKSVHQFGALSFLMVAFCILLTADLVRASEQVVFFSNSAEASANQRPAARQKGAHMSAQPSTLSGKYQAASQGERRPAAPNSSGASPSYQPPILRGPLSGPRAAGGIGKSEESQVAEWPFFKSFQTAKNNQLSNQQSQQAPPTTTTTTTATTTTAAATTTTTTITSMQIQDETTATELPDGGAPLDSAATSQEGPSTSPAPDGSPAAGEREATTTETVPVLEVDLGEMMREVRKSMTAPTTTTTTTTVAPSVSDQTDRTKQMLLMAPKMHSSIQKAVDQLVELGASVARPGGNAGDKPSRPPTVMRLNRNNQTSLKSSLSLNVLLKNLGAFNLSSLDQILLKSNLNGEPGADSQTSTSKTDSSRLSINGLHRLEGGRQTAPEGSNLEGGQDETSGAGEQQVGAGAAAECKIEYTMKHVNITLMNDDKSDYTCDYIIDRKMTKPTASRGRICKLRLRSEFFTNESSDAGATAGTCAGATHLSIGSTRFCLLGAGSARGLSLDRVFNFPIERESFDIKLVHRQVEGRRELEAHNAPGEIRLEIVPLADETCDQAATSHSSSSSGGGGSTTTIKPVESSERHVSSIPKLNVSLSGPTSGGSSSTLAPERAQTRSLPNDSVGRPATATASQEFVTRTEAEPGKKQERAKQEDGERANSKKVAKDRQGASNDQNQLAEVKPMFRLASEQQQRNEIKKGPVCERDSIHISTIGQIETPNYPNNYTANMRCRHVIKRVSRAHCKLLLHFRDFDLAPREAPAPAQATPPGESAASRERPGDEPCDGDYLQIGETRYCNKYAMLGHKMYLNFSEASTSELRDEAIALTIFSDARASGRGVLIKYQQLSCEQPAGDASKRARQPQPELPKAAPTSLYEPINPLQTLAPPLQQPDFSLGHKSESGRNQTGSGQQPASSGPAHRALPRSRLATSRERKQLARLQSGSAPAQQAAPRQPPALQTASTVATGSLSLADTPTTSASTLSSDELSSQAPSSNCNQVHNGMQFLLRSPNYPQPYDNNLACVYYVRRNSSKICYLELSFLSFQLEADSDCRYDSLEVNNVRLCGSLRQETQRIYLFDEALKPIRFKTDATNPKAGFLIRAQQLECNPDGSILRRQQEPAVLDQLMQNSTPAQGAERADKATRNNSAVFEYDSLPSQSNGNSSNLLADANAAAAANSRVNSNDSSQEPLAGRSRQLIDSSSVWLQSNNNNNKHERNMTSRQEGQQQSASSCDYLLHGSDITIRSPMWPESYATNELLASCRYTILRQNFGTGKRNSVCQLELRFVHLRLGPGDCLDIDGMELFCSFNARNLIKYYPFNERQTHLTITFSTANGAAKLFSGRSATPPYQHHTSLSQAQNQNQNQNYSDLLPTMRGPFRYMILARQLECVDDFLAPQVNLDEPGGASSQPPVNTTNLLYTGELAPIKPLHLRPRYVNRTSLAPPSTGAIISPQQVAIPTSKIDANRLNYDQPPPPPQMADKLPASLEPIPARANLSKVSLTPSGGVLMYSFANSIMNNLNTTSKLSSASSDSCLLQFNQYNGLLASSDILKAQAESSSSSWPSETGGSRRGQPPGVECEIRLKLLPGFCKIQLSFGEFDLYPSRRPSGNSLCPGEYLELAGVQYCGHELRGATRVLSITLPGQRHISFRAVQASQNSFRAIFKQLECDQKAASSSSTARPTIEMKSQVDEPSSIVSHHRASTLPAHSIGMGSIDFREIQLSSEFFELDSARLSSNRNLYEPNMFVVYRLRRSHADVCKVRLMIYKFDLERAEPQSGQCKRDFLDINNRDRLCGLMDFRLDKASREYDWPEGQQNFQVSFVSDAQNERPGFHLFGQQLRCNRSEPPPVVVVVNGAPNDSNPGSSRPSTAMTTTITRAQSDGTTPKSYTTSDEVVAPTSESVDKGGSQRRKPSKKLPANCSQIIDSLQFELASPGWPDQYDGLGACHYLVRRAKSSICSLTLKVNSLILDIHPKTPQRTIEDEGRCSSDSGEGNSEDRLEIDQSVNLCGLMTRPRSYTLHFANSTTERQFIVIKFASNQANGFGFLLEGKQNACEPPAGPTGDQQQQQQQQQVEPVEEQRQPASTAEEQLEAKHNQQHQASDKVDQPAATYQISYDDNPRAREEALPAPRQRHQQALDANNSPTKSCNRLLTGPFNLLESDNFPEPYANNLDCVYAVRRLNQSVCAIDLVFNYFDLEPASPPEPATQSAALDGHGSATAGGSPVAHQCDTDYLEIDYSRFCGSYPSRHKLRFSYFEHELDKILRFRSDAARTRIGFSISVSQVMEPSECLTSGRQAGERQQQQQQQQQQQPTQRNNSRDQESERELISYLPDSTSALELAPGAANDSQRSPSATVCSFSYQNERQLLVSPGYNAQARHYDNNLQCHYKILAAGYEICSLRLTMIELELERSRDCLNDYLLIDSRRYCGSLASYERGGVNSSSSLDADDGSSGGGGSGGQPRARPVIELDFDANLPREIELILHTDSHGNSGRGFKILAEQLPCDRSPKTTHAHTSAPAGPQTSRPSASGEPAEQEFRLAEEARNSELAVAKARQLRRMRFGQLAYPKNYVSSSGAAGRSRPAPPTGAEPTNPDGRAQARSRRPAPEAAGPQTISSDDLRLSREIVVGGEGAPASQPAMTQ